MKPFAPKPNDYIQLLNSNLQPCENHTAVSSVNSGMTTGYRWLVTDESGEDLYISRNPSFDTQERNAWIENPMPSTLRIIEIDGNY